MRSLSSLFRIKRCVISQCDNAEKSKQKIACIKILLLHLNTVATVVSIIHTIPYTSIVHQPMVVSVYTVRFKNLIHIIHIAVEQFPLHVFTL